MNDGTLFILRFLFAFDIVPSDVFLELFVIMNSFLILSPSMTHANELSASSCVMSDLVSSDTLIGY
ncbi:MAG: hypothetical protein LBL32_02045 [Holosporales bacterium]|nr:hypothetical protein [Holosporales bacterium]